MMVAVPFFCLWGSLDAVRGAPGRQLTSGWIFPLLITCSLIGIGLQLHALHRNGVGAPDLDRQFAMGVLLTAAAVLPLWSVHNLAAIRHAYETIPIAAVLPALTVVALADTVAFHMALRGQHFARHPAVSRRSVLVVETLIALLVAWGCALVVVGALVADLPALWANLQRGGLIVLAVAAAQLAVTGLAWRSMPDPLPGPTGTS